MKTKPSWHWTNQPNAEQIKERIKSNLKGRKPNAGSFQKGHKNPWEGKKIDWIGHGVPHTEEAKEKMRKNACIRKGEVHYAWKGDDVGTVALHSWVKRQLGRPMTCEKCGYIATKFTKIQWSNISHEYRRDVTDWQRLCVPCHKRYDLDFLKKHKIT